ncbi:transcriptional regulator, XRE family [Beutenbergia cavernae DSM 12333]|uniref:Transcriptional regulator, XRE family n=1 Tax=Beutenbergia cavernae (strain ATCC BAA-8 / DSM 12333 / CCUG 43141 / JCM 11478 / NBRC 16432 / NCIMB 13614 / HKI 0122) TaxID=471853 RepID=C5BV98_BEUC1|nr:helix-turn-helix transcriptional regulator [Beutenbergia cavernae]ACQ80485.1 transcriptional regulator, XRE family [Beutenbergia cavernae DSM 12333]
MSAVSTPTPFARELRRWRGMRHVSQLELSLRAGTTQRHVSFIEQGRSRPGRTMVVRLAESLELPLRERNALLLAAGYAPLFTESPLHDESLAPARAALDVILAGHLPYPAAVVGPAGELVASNAALDLLLEDAAPELLVPPVNLLRLAVSPDGLGGRVINLAAWGHHVLDSLRARTARAPDARLDALLVELEQLVPPFVPDPDHVGFAVPMRLRSADGEVRLMTTLTSFATATDVTLAELHLEAFLPADAESAAILRARAASRGHVAGSDGATTWADGAWG